MILNRKLENQNNMIQNMIMIIKKNLEDYYKQGDGKLTDEQKSALTDELKTNYDATSKEDRGDVRVPENEKMYRAYIMTEIQRSMILDIIGRMVQYQSLVK